MTENVPPGSAGKAKDDAAARGLPYYEKLRRDLRDTLNKKRLIDKTLVSTLEDLQSLAES
jgi:chromatin modification-related protein EAF6